MCNIYGTNISSRNCLLLEEVEEEICLSLKVFPNAKLILGGDWNSIKDPFLDCTPPRPVRNDKTAKIDQICLNLNCFDIWRYRNPDKSQFTWQTKDLNKQSRIDFWLISTVMKKEVKDVYIEPSVITNHKLTT